MQINIGEKIRTLRIAKNVTRERFAAFLGVTAEQVDLWEDGFEYPPLETVVLLSGYFKVPTDELLCVKQMSIEERKNSYTERYDRAMDEGKLLVAIDTMREALGHFPDDYRFKGMLMYALCCNCDRKNAVRFSSGDIIALGEDILAHCTEDDIRLEARRLLCLHYSEALGETTNSLRYAAGLPDRASSREEMLPLITDGEDKMRVLQENNAFYTASLVHSVREYAELCAKAGQSDSALIGYYNLALQVARLTHPDGDYHELAFDLMEICKSAAALYMASGDNDKALDALEAAAGFASSYDNMPYEAERTSPLFDMTVSRKPSDTVSARETMLGQLLELSCFEPIRYCDKLKEICDTLRGEDE